MIKVKNIWQHYGGAPVLRGVDLDVKQGELVVLMGPNGMGKSSLLSVVAGTVSPSEGIVEVDGMKRRGSVEEEKAIREKVVYIPDHPWLPTYVSGREFLLGVGRLYKNNELSDEKSICRHAEKLLQIFDLEGIGNQPLESYSTGQKKKIGLCGGFMTGAKIFVMDEPFSGGLDSSALQSLKLILKDFQEREDTTVLMAVPVPELVEEIADRIAIIKEGKIQAFDTMEGLRKMSRCQGSLAEVLEEIINPGSTKRVKEYIQELNRV